MRAMGWPLLLVGITALFLQQLKASADESDDALRARDARSTGPVWSGAVETTPRWLTPPPTHIFDGLCRELVVSVWMPSEAVSDALLRAAFDDATRATLVATRRCVSDGCTMRLTGDAVLGTSRQARGDLSRALGAWSQNTFYAMPMHRPQGTPRFHETPGLPPDARNVLRAASWDDDGGESVSTPRAVCAAGLLTPSRLAALRALWSVPSFDIHVRVERDDDVNRVARYWAWNRDPAQVAAQIRAQRSEHGGRVPLTALLPERLGSRIYQYAPREGDRHNCLNAVLCEDDSCPDLLDGEEAERRLRQSFRRVDTPAELRAGDAAIWRDAGGEIVHGAAWLSDGLIFTKNGVSYLRPWHIARIEAVEHIYRNATRLEYWQRIR